MRFDALGFDPAPGDPAAGADMVATLRRATASLGEINTVLSGTGDQRWEGRAADEFRGLMKEELRPRIDEAHASFDHATRALDTWVNALPGFQARANALERRAEEAVSAAMSANSLVGTYSVAPASETEDEREERASQLQEHREAAASASADLEEIRAQARTLLDEVNDSAGTAASALHTAMQAAPNEPGFWDRVGGVFSDIGDFFVGVGQTLADAYEWVGDNWETIWDTLVTTVKIVGAVLAVVALFATTGPWGALALGFFWAGMGMTLVDALRGKDGAWAELAIGAVGFGAGRLIGQVLKPGEYAFKMGLWVPTLSAGPGGQLAATVVPRTATIAFHLNPQFLGIGLTWAGYQLKKGYDTGKGLVDTVTEELDLDDNK